MPPPYGAGHINGCDSTNTSLSVCVCVCVCGRGALTRVSEARIGQRSAVPYQPLMSGYCKVRAERRNAHPVKVDDGLFGLAAAALDVRRRAATQGVRGSLITAPRQFPYVTHSLTSSTSVIRLVEVRCPQRAIICKKT